MPGSVMISNALEVKGWASGDRPASDWFL